MSETKNAKSGPEATSKKSKTNRQAGGSKAVAAKNPQGDLKVAQPPKNELKKVESKKGDAKKAAKAAPTSNPFDKVLWLLALALIVIAIGGNYYYTKFIVLDESSLERLLRVGAVIVVIALGLLVTLFTTKGRKLLAFGRDSYTELRKVIWPTRTEATQTTFIVFAAVCLVSIFLYLCDLVFLQIVRIITI